MNNKEEKTKKPWLPRLRERVSMRWESLSNVTQTLIGIGIIIFLGTIACSPILVFSSDGLLSSIPYKIPVFLVLSGIFLTLFYILPFKYISGLSKTLKTFYGWDDAIAVLLFIYGIFCYIFPPNPDLNRFTAFLFDFRAELIGAGIATLLIGNASQAAQIKEEKKRLILQMGSPDNGFAVEAVRQLRKQGWLEDGSIKGVSLNRADLSGAILYGANLSGGDMYRTNLSRSDLQSASLSGAWMWEANLSGAILHAANLNEADLRGANLGGADLQLANIQFTILSEVNLWHANLSGADLKETNLSEATNLADAFYTEGEQGTVFPEGFNPDDYGMHLIHEGESFEEAVKRVFPDRS